MSYVGKALLAGPVALITGGAPGIARAVAIAYTRGGADVAISYLVDKQVDADEANALVENAGRRCRQRPDIRDRDVAEFGGFEVLVNTAAAQTMNDLDSLDDEMQAAVAAHVFAMIRIATAAAPHMKPGSAVANTACGQAWVAFRSMIVNAATKRATSSLTVGLANLPGPTGIRVIAQAPGTIWTSVRPIAKCAKQCETLGQDTPIGRAGRPAELAPAYLLLGRARTAIGRVR